MNVSLEYLAGVHKIVCLVYAINPHCVVLIDTNLIFTVIFIDRDSIYL